MDNQLETLFQTFINESRFSARLRPETLRGYAAVFKLFLKVMPDVVGLTSLTNEMLVEFFKRIETRQRMVGKELKTGVKKSTVRTQWTKLNVFFVWLLNRGHIKQNPLKDIRPPSVSYDDFRRLENHELDKIYSAITRSSGNALILRRDLMMVSLLLYLGIRKGEFISLQVKDIDLFKNHVTVRAETSKSKRQRVLHMHPTLVMHVKDYMKERNSRGLKTQFLIVSTKKDAGLTRDGLKHWVKGLIQKSGVKLHLHRFRHTFACKLAEADVNTFKIQKLMGHSSIDMTMKYARSLRTEDMAEDIGKITI